MLHQMHGTDTQPCSVQVRTTASSLDNSLLADVAVQKLCKRSLEKFQRLRFVQSLSLALAWVAQCQC